MDTTPQATGRPEDLAYSPYDYAVHEDPYPTYARLRDEAPLYRNDELDFWALSRHADVAAAKARHAERAPHRPPPRTGDNAAVSYAIDGLRGGEMDGDAAGGPRARPGEPGWGGPEWDDPVLTTLARQLRDAHRLVAPLPADTRRRLIRHLLAITDLAKRDPELAARRLATFLADFDEAGGEDVRDLE